MSTFFTFSESKQNNSHLATDKNLPTHFYFWVSPLSSSTEKWIVLLFFVGLKSAAIISPFFLPKFYDHESNGTKW